MRRLLLAAALPLALVSAGPASAAQTAPAYVATAGFQYLPGDVTVLEGSTLTLVNGGNAVHDLVSSDVEGGNPLFKAPPIAGAGTAAVVDGVAALTPGIYPFYCSLHEAMRGTITIVTSPV
jgi:plastocyanin